MMQLSKSDYLMFLKHPAWMWLKKHDKSKLPPIDANTQAIFDAGHAFESYVEAQFPDGITLGFDNYDQYLTLPGRTAKAVEGNAQTLFQGRVEADELTCIFDMIHRMEGNLFDLYEIKSSTKEKPEHILDLAFQKLVLEQSNVRIRNVFVIVVNADYIRHGEVDPKQLTRTIDVTERVNAIKDQTQANIKRALEIMHAPTCPNLSPRHAEQAYLKEWLEIFLTLKLQPDPYSIYQINPPSSDLLGELEDQGIERMSDIPDDFTFGNIKHKRQVELTKIGEPLIQIERICEFLKSFQFPLYFLDYETMMSVVPPFDGSRPFHQIPMQYSVHILPVPGVPLEHREFLHTDKSNPSLPLLKQMQQDIGPVGSVIVWHESFEKGRNQKLGEMFPEFAGFMTQLNSRVIDLKTPFSEGWYEDARFYGSASIKKVLPVLVPELSYTELAVHEGQSAQRLWMDVVLNDKYHERREQIFKDLLEYCGLDTLAMVRIFEKLVDTGKGVSNPLPVLVPIESTVVLQPGKLQQGRLFD
ncbi:MAG: DUF2779 domain-containing protein [Patescibacteria group bacterium]